MVTPQVNVLPGQQDVKHACNSRLTCGAGARLDPRIETIMLNVVMEGPHCAAQCPAQRAAVADTE